jgi:hypothetical protein
MITDNARWKDSKLESVRERSFDTWSRDNVFSAPTDSQGLGTKVRLCNKRGKHQKRAGGRLK